MHAVVRRYQGASALVEGIVKNEAEIVALLKGVPGFRAYNGIDLGDGGVITVTVCDDKAGTDESVRVAADWIQQNLAGASFAPPEISEGEVFLNI